MSLRGFFKFQLPDQYFDNSIPWISRLTQLAILPFDILQTALSYIPDLHDMKNRRVPQDGLTHIGFERFSPKYDIETWNGYNDRLYNAWTYWMYSGSRYGLFNIYKAVGYTLDQNVPVRAEYYEDLYDGYQTIVGDRDSSETAETYRYGFEELANQSIGAYWADDSEPEENNAMCWDMFYWDGYIDTRYYCNIYVSDVNENYYKSDTRALEIVDIFYRFGPGHTNVYCIYFTDGAGNIIHTYNVREASWD